MVQNNPRSYSMIIDHYLIVNKIIFFDLPLML